METGTGAMFARIYGPIAVLAVLSQVLLLWHAIRNYRYAVHKARRIGSGYRPCVLLTVPCKGIDQAFDVNITSILRQDYPAWDLHFVVQDKADPAHARLEALCRAHASACSARTVRILVAGCAEACSQKIHNLLCSCREAATDVDVLAFADSDACLDPSWLAHLVSPVRREPFGAATGYRWFVPRCNNLASLALSAINAKVAGLLGNTPFNLAWGGSMAIRMDMFQKTGLAEIWSRAVSDDLCLTYAVKKARRKVAFVPACLVASYEATTWTRLFEFGRRQFVITRVTLPGSWWFALVSALYAVLGLWGTLGVAVVQAWRSAPQAAWYFAVPAVFFLAQLVRAILRQRMITRILPEDAARMTAARWADILGASLWTWVLLACILSSAVGRTIIWRGIRYRLVGRTAVERLNTAEPT